MKDKISIVIPMQGKQIDDYSIIVTECLPILMVFKRSFKGSLLRVIHNHSWKNLRSDGSVNLIRLKKSLLLVKDRYSINYCSNVCNRVADRMGKSGH